MDDPKCPANYGGKVVESCWEAPLDVTTWVVYVVAVLLLAAVVLFLIGVFFKKRPQKIAFIFMLLTVPLYLVYYDDRFRAIPGLDGFKARAWAGPILPERANADPYFQSHIAPAIMLGVILLFHLIVLQRLAAREHLQRIANLTSTFFAGSTAASSSTRAAKRASAPR